MRYRLLLIGLLASVFTQAQAFTEMEKDSLVTALFQRKTTAVKQEVTDNDLSDFSFTWNGRTFTKESLLGKTVLLQFWPDLEKSSLAELQVLNELYNSLRGHSNFECIGFVQGPADSVNALCKRYDIGFKLISISPEESIRLNNQNRQGGSILLDQRGLVRYRSRAAQLEKWKATKNVFLQLYPVIKELL
jgi:peroxiredoxin